MCAVSQNGFAEAADSSSLSLLCFPSNSLLDMSSPSCNFVGGRQQARITPADMRSSEEPREANDSEQHQAKRRDAPDGEKVYEPSLALASRAMSRAIDE